MPNQGPLGNCYIENSYLGNIGFGLNLYLNILSKYTKNCPLELCLYYVSSGDNPPIVFNYNVSKIFLYVEDEQFYVYTPQQCIITDPNSVITNQKLYLIKEICQDKNGHHR